MQFNTIVRFSNSTGDEDVKKSIVSIANQTRFRNLKKGIRLLNGKVLVGLNGTDFIEDKYTVRISFDSYKVPRIVSCYLLEK